MELITNQTDLKPGDKIFAPELNETYVIVDFKRAPDFKQMWANLAPLDKSKRGFTISQESMVDLNYEVDR